MKLPLFDIDGTLLKGGGGNSAHRAGFDYAFQKVYNFPDISVNEITTDGMIDKQIILEVLKFHRVPEEEILAKIDSAIDSISEYFFAHEHETESVAADGAKELLEALREQKVPLGLLTGNIKEIGLRKLKRAGLVDYFEFGAFGNQAYKRVDLISLATEEANRRLRTTYSNTDCIIIGDSPLDVLCAKQGNIPVIGVAAANFSLEELRNAGADLVVKSLKELDQILKFLQ